MTSYTEPYLLSDVEISSVAGGDAIIFKGDVDFSGTCGSVFGDNNGIVVGKIGEIDLGHHCKCAVVKLTSNDLSQSTGDQPLTIV